MTRPGLEANYYNIGAFVLIGLALVIAALLVFGSSKLFRPTVYIETYFDESVQGISDGSPVKYRGIQVGYVKDISFLSEVYGAHETGSFAMHSRAIYVKIAITSKLFTRLSHGEFEKLIDEQVKLGLRVKLESQGLTGLTYLELNYIDPKANPVPNLEWEPDYIFVPSAASTLTRLSESLQEIMGEMKDVDFKALFDNVGKLAISLNEVATKANNTLSRSNGPLETSLLNLKQITDNLNAFTEQLKLYPSQVFFGKPPPPIDTGKL
jgi:ABC-type transporter Mla subunit MlaD